MGTNNLRLWKQIEPELYVHATCRDTISSELQISSLREFSAAAARVSFNEYFGEELDFEISIEEGSLKLRIVATISGVLIILSQYGNIRSGLDYLCNDVRKVLEYVKKPIIESEYISDPIRVERRLGVVGRVDKTLLDYQKGRITLEECREIPRHILFPFFVGLREGGHRGRVTGRPILIASGGTSNMR
jgi:hypothetical protein